MRATEEFDRAAPQEVGALAGTRVTGTPGGTWWLHDPRSREPVARVSPSHGGTRRCHGPDGSVMFLPTAGHLQGPDRRYGRAATGRPRDGMGR
jgi:hypothetical protein